MTDHASRQWFWGAWTGWRTGAQKPAGDRFVVAQGRRLFWDRVRAEVEPDEHCAWMGFGPADAEPTLADCFRVLLTGREVYGANYNRAAVELAQVPAFARFVREAPADLCNSVSNPISSDPLSREPYTRDAERRLGQAVARTLGLQDGWWE